MSCRIRYIRILTGFVLAGSLLFSSVCVPAEENLYAGTEHAGTGHAGTEHAGTGHAGLVHTGLTHADIDFDDLVYTGVDSARLDILLEELRSVIGAADDLSRNQLSREGILRRRWQRGDLAADESRPDLSERAMDLYEEILRETDAAYTQCALSSLDYYCHSEDTEREAVQQEDYACWQEMADNTLTALQEAAGSACGNRIRKTLDPYQAAFLEDYIAMTDEAALLFEEENRLTQEYYHIVGEETPEGQPAGILSPDQNDRAAAVLCELIRVRTQAAKEYGYDSYVDFAGEQLYGRDYSREETAMFREAVKEHVVPLFLAVTASCSWGEFTLTEAQRDTDNMLDAVGRHLSEVDPGLLEAWNYFHSHRFLVAGSSSDMVDTAFTDILPELGAAYIFLKLQGTAQDYESLVHEFGHYNAAFHAGTHAVFQQGNIDVAEIQSQALELLFMDSMQKIFPEYGKQLRLRLLDSILYNIVSGCLFDEFQERIYSDPDMNVEKMNRCMADLEKQYGLREGDDPDSSRDWADVAHTFDAPFYYISYATSAVAALEILTEAEQDRAGAVNRYMQITAIPEEVPFGEALAMAGLPDVLEPEQTEEIAGEVYSILRQDLRYAPEDFQIP